MVKVKDKLICIDTVRDGNGPCGFQDEGTCGYPMIEVNEKCTVTDICGDRIQLSVGDRIEFMCRVSVSDKDPKFGFFSRPTKIKVISK